MALPRLGRPALDPVVADDGHTYEREEIERHIAGARQSGKPIISPMTREPMEDTLRENRVFKAQIEAFMREGHPLPEGVNASAWKRKIANEKSLRAIDERVKLGDAKAMHEKGTAHELGQFGLAPDTAAAFEWYCRGCETVRTDSEGCISCVHSKAVCLIKGWAWRPTREGVRPARFRCRPGQAAVPEHAGRPVPRAPAEHHGFGVLQDDRRQMLWEPGARDRGEDEALRAVRPGGGARPAETDETQPTGGPGSPTTPGSTVAEPPAGREGRRQAGGKGGRRRST